MAGHLEEGIDGSPVETERITKVVGKVDFVDVLSTPDCPTQREHLLERFHAQRLGGPLLSGAAAFALLWRSLPLLRPLGEIARIPFVLRILEILYLRFLAIRPKLQIIFANRGD